MLVIEKSLEFKAPPEKVWAVIADHSRMPEWAQMRSVTITSSQTEGVGLTCDCDFGLFRAEERVTEWQDNRKIAHQLIAMGMPMTEMWELESVEGGTRFIWRQEIDASGIRRLMAPMMKWQMGRTFDKALRNLKALIERESQGGSRQD
ncbi:MAG: SRPBCC family protein [Nitrospiraceae bacterium]